MKDLEEVLTFLRENDDIAKSIALEGYNLIWNHLTSDSVECYWKHLLQEYQRLLTYQPIRDTTLINITNKMIANK